MLNFDIRNWTNQSWTPIGVTILMDGLQEGQCVTENVSSVTFCSNSTMNQEFD